MIELKKLLPVAALGLLCVGAAVAQNAPPPDRHAWMEAHKGDMAKFNAQMCTDMYAHHVGMVAELGARLNLNDSQRSLFERWKTVSLDGAKAREAACQSHTPGNMDHRPSLPEREARMREHLKARLAEMDAQQPALDALYNSLSPDQKMELDHMHGGEHRGMHGGMRGGMHGMHPGMGGPEGGPGPDGGNG
ncbi:MAG TPA: Spy/CpxP family protein refolding chaperone [Rhizomicrobium sp.]|jgi:hypothetical protein